MYRKSYTFTVINEWREGSERNRNPLKTKSYGTHPVAKLPSELVVEGHAAQRPSDQNECIGNHIHLLLMG